MSTAAPSTPRGPAPAPAPGRFDDSPFIRACRSQSVPHVPVWFMRVEIKITAGAGGFDEAVRRICFK